MGSAVHEVEEAAAAMLSGPDNHVRHSPWCGPRACQSVLLLHAGRHAGPLSAVPIAHAQQPFPCMPSLYCIADGR